MTKYHLRFLGLRLGAAMVAASFSTCGPSGVGSAPGAPPAIERSAGATDRVAATRAPGSRATGSRATGSRATGSRNTGSRNTGSRNTGSSQSERSGQRGDRSRDDPNLFSLSQVEPPAEVVSIRAALDRGAHRRALSIARGALAEERPPAVAGSLRWLFAEAAAALGETEASVRMLDAIAQSEHPLAPWAAVRLSSAEVESAPARAADRLARWVRLPWAGRLRAASLRARALVAAGRPAEAERLLRARLEAARGPARAPWLWQLAQLLAERSGAASRLEALSLIRALLVVAPKHPAAAAAETQKEALLASLPPAKRRRATRLSVEDELKRAQALARHMDHAAAAAHFRRVAARARRRATRCEARFGEARCLYRMRDREKAAKRMWAVANDCPAPEIRAWALYYAGRALTGLGEYERAQRRYERLERDTPQHSLADDARYRAALLDRELGDDRAMVARLSVLPRRYPEGDMRSRARFLLARHARSQGDLGAALDQLELEREAGPSETREDLHGRAAYWRGVVLAELGRRDEAQAAFVELIASFPLSYYAQRAYARLSSLDPAAARAAVQPWRRGPGEPLRFPRTPSMQRPAFLRALALFRVGALGLAASELRDWERRVEQPSAVQTWLVAALYDRAGDHVRAVSLSRGPLRSFRFSPPSGAHFARWRIAYPRAFQEDIAAAVSDLPIPQHLLFAIAREESGFRPDAVSPAHAYGLVQVILPTARRFGRPLGLEPTAQSLTEPVENLRIGARFMAWLWNRYAPNPALIPPAYNAGQGAVDRWLAGAAGKTLDDFVEDIPYQETRRYTRRVLQTWGTYTWLGEARLLELPDRVSASAARTATR